MNINQMNVNDSNNKIQQNKNSSKIIIIIMAFIIICLLGYIFYIKLNNDKENKSNNNQENNSSQTENNGTQENNNQNNETQESVKYTDFDEVVKEMKKLPYFEYKMVDDEIPKEVDFSPLGFDKVYHTTLSSDGKVSIKDEDNVVITLNISDVKNIASINRELFILLKNGDLYSFSFYDYIVNNKDTVTKVDKIKNVETFVILEWADCTACGGNTTLGAIDKNNKYVELESFGM